MMRLPNDYYDFVAYVKENHLKYEYIERAIATLYKVETKTKHLGFFFNKEEVSMVCDELYDLSSIKIILIRKTIVAYMIWRNKKYGENAITTTEQILGSKLATFHPMDHVNEKKIAGTYLKNEEQLVSYIQDYLDIEDNPMCIVPAILIWMGVDASDIPHIKIGNYDFVSKTLSVNNKRFHFDNLCFIKVMEDACFQDTIVVYKPSIEPAYYPLPIGKDAYLIRGFKVASDVPVSDSYVSRRIKSCFEKVGLNITSTVLKRSGMYYRMYMEELDYGFEYLTNKYTNYVIQDYKKYKISFSLNSKGKSTK